MTTDHFGDFKFDNLEPGNGNNRIEAAKEDMDALIVHQIPKRVPNGAMCFSGDFSIKNTGLDIAEVFHNPIAIFNAVCRTASQYQWNPFLQYSDLSVLGCFDFGGTRNTVSTEVFHTSITLCGRKQNTTDSPVVFCSQPNKNSIHSYIILLILL